jgi:protein tyrosine/serine phosphatase
VGGFGARARDRVSCCMSEFPPLLQPPSMFAIVEDGLFRTNQIHQTNFPFLKQLKLKTVVKLTSEDPLLNVVNFCEENNIKLIRLGNTTSLKAERSWKPVSDELVKEALEIMLDSTQHPVLLMCATGVSQTSIVVACLRRLQHWNMASILVELSLGQTQPRSSHEQYVELFDTDLVILPESLPRWFVEQEAMWEKEQREAAEKE